MPWAALAVAAVGAYSSNRAANKQVDAANAAGQRTEAQYQQTRADLDPWRQTGELGLDKLKYLLGLSGPPGTAMPEAPRREQFQRGGEPITERYERSTGRGVSYYDTRTTGYTPQQFDQAGYDQAMAEYERKAAEYKALTEGDEAFGSLLEPFDLEKFEESPAYQFNLEQGMQAINKGAAARGNYYAPQTLQDMGKFQQGLASNEFQNAYNNYNTNMENIWRRLGAMSEQGRGAATQTGVVGAGLAGQTADYMTQAGNAGAAGVMGVGNAVAGGFGNAYNNYLQQQVLSQQPTYGTDPYANQSSAFGAR